MTRIIAGRWRSRRLGVPEGKDIRPTTDRMRERLFSMLEHSRYKSLAGAQVLDLYAGTGALGLEALSRGGAHCIFVENSAKSLACLKENISVLGAEGECEVIRGRADTLGSAPRPMDLVFMDPPYRQGLIDPTLISLKAGGWLGRETTLVVELASDEIDPNLNGFTLLDDRRQGQQRLLFLIAHSQA